MGKIILHGDCRINRGAELHQLFLHLLAEPENQIEVDMSSIGKCDISFFQIICAACRSYSQNAKQIVLPYPLPSSIVDQLRKIGLAQACSACDCAECIFKTMLRQSDHTGENGSRQARQTNGEAVEK